MLGMVGGVLSMGLGSACMSWVASAAGAERSVTITTGSGASCGRRRMSDRWSILVAPNTEKADGQVLSLYC